MRFVFVPNYPVEGLQLLTIKPFAIYSQALNVNLN